MRENGDRGRSARPLRNQVALVTGAALRLGREIARALADEGADLVIHYRRSTEEAETICGEITSGGSRAWALRADLSDPAEAEQLLPRALDASKHVDILINSASIFPPSRLSQLDLPGLMESIRVNAWAPLLLCLSMASRAAGGRIVNLLDSRIQGYDPQHAGSMVSKLVLYHFTRMLALELAPRFTVNAIAPGPILPPGGKDNGRFKSQARSLPLGRAGSPRDVARAVLFLVESPFITGQTIFVDGGRHLQ